MKCFQLRWMFLILCLASWPGSARIYSYISKSSGTKTNAKYEFVIASWDDVDYNSNPCYGLKRCVIGVNHLHDYNHRGGVATVTPKVAVGSSTAPDLLTVRTMGEVGRIFKRFYSLPIYGSTYHKGSMITNECVGIFWSGKSATNINVSSAELVTGSVCGIAPPPIGVCSISEERIVLNHGSLTGDSLQGNVARGSLFVVCSQPTSVALTIRVDNNSRLSLGNNTGVYSTLRINDKPGVSGYQFVALSSGATIPITSTLGVNGAVKPGNYSGQTVAILAVP
jgi:hypothetical protein